MKVKTEVVVLKKRRPPSKETIELAQKFAGHFGSDDYPTKHLFNVLLENLVALEDKMRERFYQEQWEKGLNGRN